MQVVHFFQSLLCTTQISIILVAFNSCCWRTPIPPLCLHYKCVQNVIYGMSGRCTIDFLSNCTRCGGLTPDCTGIFMESSCQIRDDTSLFYTLYISIHSHLYINIQSIGTRIFNFVIYASIVDYICLFCSLQNRPKISQFCSTLQEMLIH